MLKRNLAGWTALLVTLTSAGSLLAHHSLAYYDISKPVRVKGVVVRFAWMNPHSILFIDQTIADGQVQRWALEGPATSPLQRMGVGKDTFKAGDAIEACGFVMKPEFESQSAINREQISESLRATSPKTISVKTLGASQVVMSDGQKRIWWIDHQDRCLGAD